MRLDLKPGITLDELFWLVSAMMHLRQCQQLLADIRLTRVVGRYRDAEDLVGMALDRLWEAQQRCLAT